MLVQGDLRAVGHQLEDPGFLGAVHWPRSEDDLGPGVGCGGRGAQRSGGGAWAGTAGALWGLHLWTALGCQRLRMPSSGWGLRRVLGLEGHELGDRPAWCGGAGLRRAWLRRGCGGLGCPVGGGCWCPFHGPGRGARRRACRRLGGACISVRLWGPIVATATAVLRLRGLRGAEASACTPCAAGLLVLGALAGGGAAALRLAGSWRGRGTRW
eukprot:1804338-Alexandrium_andersonii.AAC.1